MALFIRCVAGYEGRLSPGRTVLSTSRPVRRRPAACRAPRPDQPWYVQVLDSTSEYKFDRSCFRRNVQDSDLDSLAGKLKVCLRAGSTQRPAVLLSPAPPRGSAVRRPGPTGLWCVRVFPDMPCMKRVYKEKYWIRQVRIRLFVIPGKRSENCFRFAEEQKQRLCSGGIDPTASRPTPSRPAPPPCRAQAPPDRAVVCPGVGFDRWF